MNSRKNFEMTPDDLKTLLEACRPERYMVFGGIAPPSPQESANRAWCALGDKMGFDGMTVEPTGNGDRFFTAIPKAIEPPASIPEPPAPPAAPLDAQDIEDGVIVDAAINAAVEFGTDGYSCANLGEALKIKDEARAALLSRLSSLRESVASLTRERDDALRQMYRAERISGNLPRIAETLKAERDAARKALARLDSACQDLGAAALERWGYRAPSYLEKQWDAVAEALVESSAALSPTPSPKEAQNG